MTRIDRSRTWWVVLVVVVVGLMISQTQTAIGAGVRTEVRTSLESLQLQVDILTLQLAALQQQVIQRDSTLQQQIDQLQQQVDALQDQLTGGGEQVPNGLAVYDANGNHIGPVMNVVTPEGPVVVAVKVGERVIPLFMTRTSIGVDYSGSNNLYFETTDCTGPPFLAQSSVMLPRAIVAKPGRTVYFADPFGPSHLITQRSFLPGGDSGQPPGSCSSEAQPSVRTVVPAVPLTDLDTLFTPPFSVR